MATTAYQIRRPPTAFSLSPQKKRPRQHADKHLAWLRTLPCVISGRHPTEACHLRFAAPEWGKKATPMGMKPDDRWALPMHPDLHRDQHKHNEREWWARQAVDPIRIALALWGCSGDDEAAALVLAQARSAAATMTRTP